jgi:glutaredoxin-related protein
MSNNKAGKYLKYAIGEIILVVIGILIALQINNWNNEHQIRKKETKYLTEIKANLLLDKKNAEGNISYNVSKLAAIDTMLQLLNSKANGSQYMPYLVKNQPLLCSFPTFDPVTIAFDNMTSSYSIDIIQNDELRAKLSSYYNYDWETSPQSAVRSRTRAFADLLLIKLIDVPQFHRSFEELMTPMLTADSKFGWIDDFAMSFQDPNYLEFHNDRQAVASMFTMMPTSIYQNKWIERAAADIQDLLDMIEHEISAK